MNGCLGLQVDAGINCMRELWGDGKVLRVDVGDGCMTLNLLKSLHCHLELGEFYGM